MKVELTGFIIGIAYDTNNGRMLPSISIDCLVCGRLGSGIDPKEISGIQIENCDELVIKTNQPVKITIEF